MRDALVAGINLNIFNKHADRVHMANIAQTVNVLQSVILTEGEQMILTPTYHVFDLYQVHQDNTLLTSTIEAGQTGSGKWTVPQLHESASIDATGRIHLTLCNLSLDERAFLDTTVLGAEVKVQSAQILTGNRDDMNTFEHPDAVALRNFTDYSPNPGAAGPGNTALPMTLPACSVVRLTLA